MDHIDLIAGLSWDPAIKGILTVAVGVVCLLGSVYLIVATNTGARLGLLIALGGLFGWLSILTLFWWISPPGIGPRGQDPSWKPIELYIHEPGRAQGPAQTEVVNLLPDPVALPTAAQVLAEHPELAGLVLTKPEQTTLSDIAGIEVTGPDGTPRPLGAEVLRSYDITVANEERIPTGRDLLGGWKIVSTSQAGDAAAAADLALKDAGLFKDATEYKKLNAFEVGGNSKRAEECRDDDKLCRAVFRVKKTFRLWHAPRYEIVQVQPVIHQETVPGEPPPIPTVDPNQPVVSVVFIRDQGNVRAKPAYFFAICFSLFLVFSMLLHSRDKTLLKNRAAAEEAERDRSAGEREGRAPVKAGV